MHEACCTKAGQSRSTLAWIPIHLHVSLWSSPYKVMSVSKLTYYSKNNTQIKLHKNAKKGITNTFLSSTFPSSGNLYTDDTTCVRTHQYSTSVLQGFVYDCNIKCFWWTNSEQQSCGLYLVVIQQNINEVAEIRSWMLSLYLCKLWSKFSNKQTELGRLHNLTFLVVGSQHQHVDESATLGWWGANTDKNRCNHRVLYNRDCSVVIRTFSSLFELKIYFQTSLLSFTCLVDVTQSNKSWKRFLSGMGEKWTHCLANTVCAREWLKITHGRFFFFSIFKATGRGWR